MKQFQSTRPVQGATIGFCLFILLLKFQSTRPVWGATARGTGALRVMTFQSTRPRAGRDDVSSTSGCGTAVSIHAPRVGRDRCRPWPTLFLQSFNPRAPCGARPTATTPTALSVSFNPRAPCGARLHLFAGLYLPMSFQSTRTWRRLVRQACIQKKTGSERSISEPIAHIKITGARCYTVLRILYFTYSFFH